MRFTGVFVALAALCIVSVSTAPSPTPEPEPLEERGLIGGLLGINEFGPSNYYNAPIPPWKPGAHPGWYLGNHPEKYPLVFCLTNLICNLLNLLLGLFHCPKPAPPPPPKPPVNPPYDGYKPTFSNLNGATQGNNYLTFGLVDSVADCKAMCNSVAGCVFVNTYHDVNGKDGSTQLTCSLFSGCHTAATATNTGGQSQPNGSINYIRQSDGYCKA